MKGWSDQELILLSWECFWAITCNLKFTKIQTLYSTSFDIRRWDDSRFLSLWNTLKLYADTGYYLQTVFVVGKWKSFPKLSVWRIRWGRCQVGGHDPWSFLSTTWCIWIVNPQGNVCYHLVIEYKSVIAPSRPRVYVCVKTAAWSLLWDLIPHSTKAFLVENQITGENNWATLD